MSETVYLNGEFVLRDEAKISPDDRGFIFADGVYEVTKYYNGKPFRFDDHIKRLERSLNELNIEFDGIDVIGKVSFELLEKNNLLNKHAGIYLQITRGQHKRVHHFPEELTPSIYMFAFPLPTAIEKLEKGIKVITHEDIRWQRCDIKSISLLPNTMLYNKAVENGAGECVLIRDGSVSEATHSSVLAIKDGMVITRPLSNLILPGITRNVILEICMRNNIPFEERLFTEKELFEMDELMVTGTGSEVVPVVQVNDKDIGNKKPGEITRFIQKKFFELV